MRDKVIKMINQRVLDEKVLFDFYKRKGGDLKTLDRFVELLNLYLTLRDPFGKANRLDFKFIEEVLIEEYKLNVLYNNKEESKIIKVW